MVLGVKRYYSESMSRLLRKNQQGFTIPELLVVVVLVLALCVGSYYLLKPVDYGPQQRDAARRTAIAQIADALVKYHRDHGQLPSQITTSKRTLSTDTRTGVNICSELVPAYLKDLPMDPSLHVKSVNGDCRAKNQQYVASFLVYRSADGASFTISAPLHEQSTPIIITRHLDNVQN